MKVAKLLTRTEFREGVFKRDRYKCLMCPLPAEDAHHILERRLFPDGGYYLDNGASLCEQHHLEAEMTLLSPEVLREKAGITNIILPPHLYRDQSYSKWGDVVLPNGQRLKGELFFDESVQKILKEGKVLTLYAEYIKYPRTYHLPWSESINSDDRVVEDLSVFKDKEVVVTLKMDGENTTLYPDYLHARSLTSNPHPSRNWVKSFHARMKHNIPEGYRLCGENLYAKHSIEYQNLDSYFYLFSVWNEKNQCLSWNETEEWSKLLDLPLVKVLYRGVFDEKKIKALYTREVDGNEAEGYVLRLASSFAYKDFRTSVAKFVRANHVQTHGHWMRSVMTLNKLKG